jgi:hypothetical protein
MKKVKFISAVLVNIVILVTMLAMVSGTILGILVVVAVMIYCNSSRKFYIMLKVYERMVENMEHYLLK